uniref:Uncharacterized protein n=1 Tax=Arundo donax TaxID=35708 RepID=A0A0A9AU48_ARUDO
MKQKYLKLPSGESRSMVQARTPCTFFFFAKGSM